MLLLPLLGGYIFVRFCNHTKIHILRSDKDRLLIRASIIGLFSLILAFAIHLLFKWLFPCSSYKICLTQIWKENIPFEYLDISLIAFFIGATFWYPFNFYYTNNYEIDRAIKEDANPLELLLKRAQDETIAVLITMVNHKVYMGLITHQFNPATPTSHIGIFPLKSGYRDVATKAVTIGVNYTTTYQSILDDIESLAEKIEVIEINSQFATIKGNQDSDYWTLIERWEHLEDTINLFEVVIPTSQIASISYYDDEVYTKYFTNEESLLIK